MTLYVTEAPDIDPTWQPAHGSFSDAVCDALDAAKIPARVYHAPDEQAARRIVADLLAWAEFTGGWDGMPWRRAREWMRS